MENASVSIVFCLLYHCYLAVVITLIRNKLNEKFPLSLVSIHFRHLFRTMDYNERVKSIQIVLFRFISVSILSFSRFFFFLYCAFFQQTNSLVYGNANKKNSIRNIAKFKKRILYCETLTVSTESKIEELQGSGFFLWKICIPFIEH